MKVFRTAFCILALPLATVLAPIVPTHAASVTTTAGATQAAGAPGGGKHALGFIQNPAAQRPAASFQTATLQASLPAAVDLGQYNPPVGDQGAVGSCTSWATGYYLRGWYAKRDGYFPTGGSGGFAPMYLYSQIARGNDVGSTFAANLNLEQQQGVDTRADYAQGDFDYTNQPTAAEAANAAHFRIASYSDVGGPNLQSWIEAGIAGGNPVAVALPVYPEFDAAYGNANNWYIGAPGPGETSRGNHAVFASRYDQNGLWIENSWGAAFGQGGYAELSWAFVNQYVYEAVSEVPTNPLPLLPNVSVSVSPDGSVTRPLGQPYAITVAVIPPVGMPAPTGSVSFEDCDPVNLGTGYCSPLGNASLDSSGTARFSTSTLSQGTHALSAVYGGNSTYAPTYNCPGSPACRVVVNVGPPCHGSSLSTLPASGLSNPSSVAVDGMCDVFIADTGNGRVVELPSTGGQVTVASGLNQPEGVAVDSAGTLYIADTGNKRVLKLAAGSGTPAPLPLTGLCSPSGLATDAAGNLYIADGCGSQVVKVTPTGQQTTVGSNPYDPDAVAVDGGGNVYIASFDGNQVIKVAPNGTQSVLGINLYGPAGLAVDAAGTVYISDYFHARVLAVTSAGVQFRLPLTGLNHPSGLALDSAGTLYLADFSNNRALTLANPGTNSGWTASGFNGPEGVAVDGAGDTFVADTLNNRIVEVSAAGVHTTVQGATSLDHPASVAVDGSGTLYIADTGNQRVVKVSSAGVETTVPVSGLSSALGVAVDGASDLYIADESGSTIFRLTPGGTATKLSLAGVDHPDGVAVDGAGTLYVSNAYSGTVIKIIATGSASTVIGGLTFPGQVGIDRSGAVYAPDWGGHQVVKMTTTGTRTSVLTGQLNNPAAVAVDSAGTLYVADYSNNRVVKLMAGGAQSNL